MTIIAWDGHSLAADKQSTNFGYGSTVTKIFRVPGGVVGFTGNEGHAMALLAWFRAGRDPANWPKKGGDDSASAIFATKDGLQCYSGDDGPYPAGREDKFAAFGAGRDYALAAMYLGKSAREAVEVASHFDTSCGKGVDELMIDLSEGEDFPRTKELAAWLEAPIKLACQANK